MSDKAIFKFNSGQIALICSKCRTIIKEGKDLTKMEFKALKGEVKLPPQYCDKHKKIKPNKKINTENINNSSAKVIFEIENYLKPFKKKKICLIIRAIEEGFKVVMDKYGYVTSPNWEDSFDIYQNINNLIVENLFDISDSNGYPNAKRFVSIYMKETPNITIGEMALYFLIKRINFFDKERPLM